MGKFRYWKVKKQKLHLSLEELPVFHQPWPSMALPSSKTPVALSAGAWDMCPLFSAVQLPEHHQSSSLCSAASLPLPPPGFLIPLKTIWETTLSYTHLSCAGERHPVCYHYQLRLPDWLVVSWLRQANLNQEPGSAWRSGGFVWISPFIKPEGFFLGCGKQHLLLLWSPIQQQVLYFLPLPCKRQPPGLPELWISAPTVCLPVL